MIIALQKHNNDKKDANEYVGKSMYDQTMMFSAQFDYNRTFAKRHNVAATLLGWAPSILHILGMAQPSEMTGRDLIK